MVTLSDTAQNRLPNFVLYSAKNAETVLACRVPDFEVMEEFRSRYAQLAALAEETADFVDLDHQITQLALQVKAVIQKAVPAVLFKGAGKFKKRQQIDLIKAMAKLNCRPKEDRILRLLTVQELDQLDRTPFLTEEEALKIIDDLFSALQVFNSEKDRQDQRREQRKVLYGDDENHLGRKQGKGRFLRP